VDIMWIFNVGVVFVRLAKRTG